MMLGCCMGALQAASGSLQITRLQFQAPLEVRGACLLDINADGLQDLLVLARNPEDSKPRQLHIYRARVGTEHFAAQPDEVVALTPEVVAIAMADVAETAGLELLLFTPKALFVWVLGQPSEPKVQRLRELEFFWQIPPPLAPLLWQQGVLDLDQDGDSDLFVPEVGGWRILLQTKHAADAAELFAQSAWLPMAEEYSAREPSIHFPDSTQAGVKQRRPGGRMELSLQLGAEQNDGAMVRSSRSMPWPCAYDFDADGDLDISLLRREHWLVYLQNEAHEFAPTPTLSLLSPVPRERSRELDLSYAVHCTDLDGDRRLDALFLARDLEAKEVRTQVLVYTQATPPLFGSEGLPQELLVLSGFTRASHCADLNGDGLTDFAVTSFRPDGIDALRSASGGSLDLELLLFLRGPRGLGRQPTLRATIAMPLAERPLLPQWIGDVDGDGMHDLVVNDREGHLRVRLLRRQGKGLELHPEAFVDVPIVAGSELVLAAAGRPEFAAYSKHEVVHVTF